MTLSFRFEVAIHTNFKKTENGIKYSLVGKDAQHALGYPILDELFKKFVSIPLEDRPRIVKDYFQDTEKLNSLFIALGLPESLQLDIFAKFNRLIDLPQ